MKEDEKRGGLGTKKSFQRVGGEIQKASQKGEGNLVGVTGKGGGCEGGKDGVAFSNVKVTEEGKLTLKRKENAGEKKKKGKIETRRASGWNFNASRGEWRGEKRKGEGLEIEDWRLWGGSRLMGENLTEKERRGVERKA